MNKRRHYLWAMLGSMILVGLTACSGDDDQTDKPDDGVKVRRMTITQTDGAAARQALTRATLTEDDGLSALWTAGDRLTYCNLSRTNPEDEVYSGPLTAVSTAATSPFTGEVTCRTGDYLAVVYPATTFETNESYTISLAGQDGTLGTLATKYHYVYGKAYVTSVTDNTADATMEKMKSLLTVCKFSFVDKTTGAAIPIKTLAISYGGSGSDARTASWSSQQSTLREQHPLLPFLWTVPWLSPFLRRGWGRFLSPYCQPAANAPSTSPSPTVAAPILAPPRLRSSRANTSWPRA